MSNISNMTKHLKNGRGGAPMLKELPAGTPIQVDLKNSTKQVCPCGCSVFVPAVQIYKVSAIISPTGQELIANQQVLICADCHLVFGEEKKEKI